MASRVRFGGVAMMAVALALGCQAPGLQAPGPEASGAPGGPAVAASSAAGAALRFPLTLKASEGLAAYAQHQVRVRSLVSGALVPVAAQAAGGEVATSVAVSALKEGQLHLQNPPVGPLLLEFTKPSASAGRRLQQSSELTDFISLLPNGFLSAEEMAALASLPSISDLSSYLQATGKDPINQVINPKITIVQVGPEANTISSLSSMVFQNSILNGPDLPCSFPNSNQAIMNLSQGLDQVGSQITILNLVSVSSSISVFQIFQNLKRNKAKHNKRIDENNANTSIRSRALAQATPEAGPCDGGSPQDGLARFKAQVKEAGLGEVLNDAFFERLNLAYFGLVPSQPWPLSPSVAPGASPSAAAPSPSPLEPQPSPSRNETGTEGTDRPDPEPIEET